MLAISLILLFFLYHAYTNSRQALEILETQVPNITRVAFETEVFAPTQGNLDPVLKRFTGFATASEIEKFKKEFDSYLRIGTAIRNRGLKNAPDVSARIRLSTPIMAVRGFNSTVYARLETKEGGVGKDALSQLPSLIASAFFIKLSFFQISVSISPAGMTAVGATKSRTVMETNANNIFLLGMRYPPSEKFIEGPPLSCMLAIAACSRHNRCLEPIT